MNFVDQAIEAYASNATKAEPALLNELAQETQRSMEFPQMLTGRIEGRFLKLMVALTGAKSILEVGTFTGYSALSMAEALPDDGKIITCEINPKAQNFAQNYFDRSPHGKKIEIKMGPALKTIEALAIELDLAFIDADKENLSRYYEALLIKLKPGGIIVIDNALWSSKVLNPQDSEAKSIHALNEFVAKDSRVENVLLTIRDGVNLIRKV